MAGACRKTAAPAHPRAGSAVPAPRFGGSADRRHPEGGHEERRAACRARRSRPGYRRARCGVVHDENIRQPRQPSIDPQVERRRALLMRGEIVYRPDDADAAQPEEMQVGDELGRIGGAPYRGVRPKVGRRWPSAGAARSGAAFPRRASAAARGDSRSGIRWRRRGGTAHPPAAAGRGCLPVVGGHQDAEAHRDLARRCGCTARMPWPYIRWRMAPT